MTLITTYEALVDMTYIGRDVLSREVKERRLRYFPTNLILGAGCVTLVPVGLFPLGAAAVPTYSGKKAACKVQVRFSAVSSVFTYSL